MRALDPGTPPRADKTWTHRLGTLPFPYVAAVAFVCVALLHITLLRLPYFWDEGGYYVPAALDSYRTGALIPQFTNAHPPLPSVVLGSFWHIFGLHILVTRLLACAFAALALAAVFALSRALLGAAAALAVVSLTAVYPIWFAQSSLAHADIFAAAFTLIGLWWFLSSPDLIGRTPETFSPNSYLATTSATFCLAVLSKETAIVQPAALACAQLVLAYRARTERPRCRAHLRWAGALSVPAPVLAAWFAYHDLRTGHIFGNPAYLRYNATANFTLSHVLYALRIRCVHVFWQREMWIPLLLAAGCLLLSPRSTAPTGERIHRLPDLVIWHIAVVVAANLLFFSVLGGALLTRYLLPVYPLLLLTAVAIWRERITYWPWLAGLTAVAFISAIWLNPFTFFAPEDNLTYRNMVLVHEDAIHFLEHSFPHATVLTAWPAAAELTRPELGYTANAFRVVGLENFTRPELAKAAAEPGSFDTALVFTTHYTSPAFRQFLLTHPRSWRGRRYAQDLDFTPDQIAQILGGTVVWRADRYGEWAAVLRFPRSYDADASFGGPGEALRYSSASQPRQ